MTPTQWFADLDRLHDKGGGRPGVDRISLFLSVAEEDGSIGREIYDSLTQHGFDVYFWEVQRGGRFIEDIDKAINKADAFIAVMSPHFITSQWCNNERELAMLRESDLRERDPDRVFIHVLEVAETDYTDSGFLRLYDWSHLADPATRTAELDRLSQTLQIRRAPAAGVTVLGEVASLFRNREDELEKAYRGITNAAGPHFWLVVAPPQLGKTWFLNRLSASVASDQYERAAKDESANGQGAKPGAFQAAAKPWVIRLVDIRQQPAEIRMNAAAVLALLAGRVQSESAEIDADSVAAEICASGQPHLWLLDSAELLSSQTADDLRQSLSSIYQSIQDAGTSDDVRLAVVVGSRQESNWNGVWPEPRLSALPLTEFKQPVVQGALRHLAGQMGRTFSAEHYKRHASAAYQLSEGLPALLLRCMQWIQEKSWVNVSRLADPAIFDELVHSYVEAELLSFESLFSWSKEPAVPMDGQLQRELIDDALHALVPYRLFTQSHLRNHIDSSPAFGTSLERLGWSQEDLWAAISGTALLKRPLDEVWQELHVAIRRVLFRYYYKSPEQQADAHREARGFMQVWAREQSGKDLARGHVECLWHEACELQLRGSAEMASILCESAEKLSMALALPSGYSMSEVRGYASDAIKNDEELQQVVRRVDGLADRLAAIVGGSPSQLSA